MNLMISQKEEKIVENRLEGREEAQVVNLSYRVRQWTHLFDPTCQWIALNDPSTRVSRWIHRMSIHLREAIPSSSDEEAHAVPNRVIQDVLLGHSKLQMHSLLGQSSLLSGRRGAYHTRLVAFVSTPLSPVGTMSLTMTIFDVFESNGLLPLIAALALIGALWLLCLVLKTLCRIVRGFRAYVLPLRFPPNLKRYGSWAIITGSTDGIGKGYAEELASRGLNVFLISRNQQKLDQVAAEMEKFGVQVKTLAIDFGSEENYFDKIRHQVSSMSDIGILVNNVGIGYDFPEYFLEVEGGEKLYQDMIRINMTSMTMMTHIVLPKMVENRRGLVINLSSVSGEGIPMPLLAVYSASKAYADFFSRALHGEYSSRGITVQSVLPGYVATNLSKIRQARLDAPSPRTFARSALGTVGKFERTNGYWIHSIMAWFMFDLMSAWIIKIILVRELIKARNAGLKSKERE